MKAGCVSPSNFKYIYDYFLKDHLGNVRMVITGKIFGDKGYNNKALAETGFGKSKVFVKRILPINMFFEGDQTGVEIILQNPWATIMH